MRHLYFMLACVSALCMAPAAMADKGGHDHGKGHEWREGHGHKDAHHHGRDDVRIVIGGSDRIILRDYLTDYYRCPPGLAKKHNGCRPPGQVKHYVIGQQLPDDVIIRSLPQDVLVRLHPVPGYRYVAVDQNILLISEATKKVMDAVTLYSAVGR